jgi:hypothetical protein
MLVTIIVKFEILNPARLPQNLNFIRPCAAAMRFNFILRRYAIIANVKRRCCDHAHVRRVAVSFGAVAHARRIPHSRPHTSQCRNITVSTAKTTVYWNFKILKACFKNLKRRRAVRPGPYVTSADLDTLVRLGRLSYGADGQIKS